jgi:periplasmic protein TonB
LSRCRPDRIIERLLRAVAGRRAEEHSGHSMSVRGPINMYWPVAAQGWATSLAVHAALLVVLVGWQGAPATAPRLQSHWGQTSLLLSAADPNPGRPDVDDPLVEPSVMIAEPAEMPSQAVPAAAIPQEAAPADNQLELLASALGERRELSVLPPQAALEPIDPPPDQQPQRPAPGDDTPTASAPSPGRLGNEQPSEPAFDSNPPIVYPPAAVRDGLEGTVLLRIRIGTKGRVIDVELVRSSGSAILDRAAIEGVRSWHGEPARIAGRAIEATALLPVVFRLH